MGVKSPFGDLFIKKKKFVVGLLEALPSPR